MSRERDERRRGRIADRENNGTYTPSAATLEISRLAVKAHTKRDGTLRACVFVENDKISLCAGLMKGSKEIASTTQRGDRAVREICEAALANNRYIFKNDWIPIAGKRISVDWAAGVKASSV